MKTKKLPETVTICLGCETVTPDSGVGLLETHGTYFGVCRNCLKDKTFSPEEEMQLKHLLRAAFEIQRIGPGHGVLDVHLLWEHFRKHHPSLCLPLEIVLHAEIWIRERHGVYTHEWNCLEGNMPIAERMQEWLDLTVEDLNKAKGLSPCHQRQHGEALA